MAFLKHYFTGGSSSTILPERTASNGTNDTPFFKLFAATTSNPIPTTATVSDASKGCPYRAAATATVSERRFASGCPFSTSESTIEAGKQWDAYTNPLNNMPDVPNHPLEVSTLETTLSKERKRSSIPKTGSNEKWMYPSPQQFYNSLKRKNKAEAAEHMDSTVYVHNKVNEISWKHILEWESLHKRECTTPTLTRFVGNSEKVSPRAQWMSLFSHMGKPFDRHDWYIERCGKQIRYVLDYYDDPRAEDDIQIYVDVRPAMDSLPNILDRLRKPFA